MSAGHTHFELAGSELIAGILTGLAMCAVHSLHLFLCLCQTSMDHSKN